MKRPSPCQYSFRSNVKKEFLNTKSSSLWSSTREIPNVDSSFQCQNFYEGETYRPCHDRTSEHVRAANNPSTYPKNAIGKHVVEHHVNCVPKLTFTILDKQSSTARRKIS